MIPETGLNYTTEAIKPIDISNWYFSDSDSSHKFIFPNGTIIEPDSYLVVVENDSAFTSRFPDVKNYIGETGFGLSGSGEFIKLVNDEGQIIDSLTYDDSLPWPVDADGGGATLELIDADSNNSLPENWEASMNHGTPGKLNSVLISVDENESTRIPREFLLSQNYPNPFNPATNFEFRIPDFGFVTFKIYDVLGNEVATLVNEEKPAGNYTVKFNGSNLSSGIYFYQIIAGANSITRKMILLK